MLRLAVATFAVLVLASCAPSMETVRQQHSQVSSCCASLSELGYVKLGASDDQAFELGKDSRAYAFETGRSYFRAFELPEGGPHEVTLSSYVVGDPPNWYVFCPVVLMLDSGFRPLRTIGTEVLRWETATVFETSGWRKKLVGNIQVGAGDERYLVIHTTDPLLAQASNVEMQKFVVVVPYTDVVAVPNAPAGNLRVRLGSR